MQKRPPMHPTNLTPEEIVGSPDDMGILESHYIVSRKNQDPERYEKAMQTKFKDPERKLIASLYEKLRDHGFWPSGVDSFGNITWSYALKGDLQIYVESLPLIPRKDFNLHAWLR